MTTDRPCLVGLTPATTQDGRLHLDGAAAVITEDDAWALAEERVSRNKHDGGSELSLHTVLEAAGRSLDDVTGFFVSTCGESVPRRGAPCVLSTRTARDLRDLAHLDRITWVPSHHLSHAWGAWAASGLQRTVVFVADEAGSAVPISDGGDGAQLERTSCYLADSSGISPLFQFATPPGGPGGAGLMFRHVTDFLGMDGMRDGGKTMALSAFGRNDVLTPLSLMHRCTPEATRLLDDDGSSLVRLLEEAKLSVRRQVDGSSFAVEHLSLARLAQDELERSTLELLRRVLRVSNARDLCLSGGVALNCVLAGRLVRELDVDRVFVAPAPGDTGQALGNCLWGASATGMPIPSAAKSLYLGPKYNISRVARALRAWEGRFQVVEGEVPERVAESLITGKVVALFHGRSEYGPRALGHRSILADPRRVEMPERLNRRVKGREPYRPFGMAMLAEATSALFGMSVRSDAMMLALPLAPAWRRKLPAVCHADGTSRFQTVDENGDTQLRKILEAFMVRTGVPAVVNTSFNLAGSPIVESPEDALAAFERMDIDVLAIESFFIERVPGGQ